MRFLPKDPDAVKDYVLDLEEWLNSDTISTATWTVPSGITEDSSSNTTTTATIWLSGGTAGQEYDLVCQVVTAGGRTEDFSITVPVAESVAAKVYGSLAEVAAMVGRYTSSGSFTTSTRPTQAEVQRFLERVSALLNTLLATEGFSIPVTQADAKLALDDFVVNHVVQLCHAANGAGPYAPGSEELRGAGSAGRAGGRTPMKVILDEAKEFVELYSAGLEALGATRTRSAMGNLECRTSDDAGDELVPMFQREMIGHSIVDWGA